MPGRDYSRLMHELDGEFATVFPRSAAIQRDASRNLVDGGSHTLRLIRPSPARLHSQSAPLWSKDSAK